MWHKYSCLYCTSGMAGAPPTPGFPALPGFGKLGWQQARFSLVGVDSRLVRRAAMPGRKIARMIEKSKAAWSEATCGKVIGGEADLRAEPHAAGHRSYDGEVISGLERSDMRKSYRRRSRLACRAACSGRKIARRSRRQKRCGAKRHAEKLSAAKPTCALGRMPQGGNRPQDREVISGLEQSDRIEERQENNGLSTHGRTATA